MVQSYIASPDGRGAMPINGRLLEGPATMREMPLAVLEKVSKRVAAKPWILCCSSLRATH